MSTAWKQNSTRAKGWEKKGQENSKKMKNEFGIPLFQSWHLFPHYVPQIGDTVGGISQLKLGFVMICGTGEMHVVRGDELTRPFKKKKMSRK